MYSLLLGLLSGNPEDELPQLTAPGPGLNLSHTLTAHALPGRGCWPQNPPPHLKEEERA